MLFICSCATTGCFTKMVFASSCATSWRLTKRLFVCPCVATGCLTKCYLSVHASQQDVSQKCYLSVHESHHDVSQNAVYLFMRHNRMSHTKNICFLMKTAVSWDVMPSTLVDSYRRFIRTFFTGYVLHVDTALRTSSLARHWWRSPFYKMYYSLTTFRARAVGLF